MKMLSPRLLLAAVLLAPLTVAPSLFAEDRTYHDKAHKDDHHWDAHEDKAYSIWLEQNHRKHAEFSRLNARDQQSYWNWRHQHDDVSLHINIP
jgi:hypothetical protein